MAASPGLLSGVIVVEWGEFVAVPACGRILASPPLRTRDVPSQNRRPAPCLGEHNDDVFGQLLGIKDAEIDRLEREQVFS